MKIAYFQSRELLIFTVVIVAMSNMMLNSDIYIPALPIITHQLFTTPHKVKLSISLYLFAAALPLLFYGSLADRFGRRPLLIWGSSLGAVGSLLCIAIPSIYALLAGRIVQGIGMAAMAGVGRAVFLDTFQGQRLTVALSHLAFAVGFIPLMAPLLGGFLLHFLGWHSIFIFLFLYSTTTLAVVIKYLPETLTKRDVHALKWSTLHRNYRQLLTHLPFLSYALASGVSLGGMMVYYTMSPFLLQRNLGLTPLAYSWSIASITLFMLIGRACNMFAVRHWQPEQLVKWGIWLMLACALGMAGFGFLYHLNFISIILPMMIYMWATGIVMVNSTGLALTPFKHIGGMAGACFATIQIMTAGISSGIAAHLPNHNQIPMALIMITIVSIPSLLLLLIGKLPRKIHRQS